MLEQPLRPTDARNLIRAIIDDGEVEFWHHALDEMVKDGLSQVDCLNVLRGGWRSGVPQRPLAASGAHSHTLRGNSIRVIESPGLNNCVAKVGTAMNCPECGGRVTQCIGDHPYLGDELPNVVLVDVKIRTCAECGFGSVAIPKLTKLHKALAVNLAKATHQLSPGEIRFLRKYLGWSGQDFARHFGVSPETVSRWENGKKPMGATAERLLRMSALTLDPVQEYPLPDSITKRSDKRELRATLCGDWRLEAA